MSDAGICRRVANYDELLQYSISLVQSIEKLHSQAGILHCDIKPDKVVRHKAKGEVTIIDFGHAQEANRTVSIRGTKGFVAPEVALGHQPNTRASDAYNTGATLRFLDNTLFSVDEPIGRQGDKDKYSGSNGVVYAPVTADPGLRMTLRQALDVLGDQTGFRSTLQTASKEMQDQRLFNTRQQLKVRVAWQCAHGTSAWQNSCQHPASSRHPSNNTVASKLYHRTAPKAGVGTKRACGGGPTSHVGEMDLIWPAPSSSRQIFSMCRRRMWMSMPVEVEAPRCLP